MRRKIYLKDNKKRNLYKKWEIIQKVLKTIKYYCKKERYITLNLYRITLHMRFKKSYKTRLKNYCMLSGRARSICRKARVSRMGLRTLGANGLLFGLKKAS